MRLFAVIAVDDTTSLIRQRGLYMLLLVVSMFAIAGMVLAVGKARQKRRSGRHLSSLTGVAKGAHRADDTIASTDGWADQAVHDNPSPDTGWRSAILGDELADNPLPAPVTPIPLAARPAGTNPTSGYPPATGHSPTAPRPDLGADGWWDTDTAADPGVGDTWWNDALAADDH